MKKLILVLLLLATTQLHAGWFDHKEDKQRIQNLEQELAHQRYTTGTWQIVAGVVFVGGVVLFVVGTALGSKIRRHANDHRES